MVCYRCEIEDISSRTYLYNQAGPLWSRLKQPIHWRHALPFAAKQIRRAHAADHLFQPPRLSSGSSDIHSDVRGMPTRQAHERTRTRSISSAKMLTLLPRGQDTAASKAAADACDESIHLNRMAYSSLVMGKSSEDVWKALRMKDADYRIHEIHFVHTRSNTTTDTSLSFLIAPIRTRCASRDALRLLMV